MTFLYRKVPKHWKYQLTAAYEHELGFDVRQYFPAAQGLVASVPGMVDLYADGRLVIHDRYAWDGASGPTLDTPSAMRGSLVHDALYQLIREGLLPVTSKPLADAELRRVCVEDGMWRWRAVLWEWSLNQVGWTAL